MFCGQSWEFVYLFWSTAYIWFVRKGISSRKLEAIQRRLVQSDRLPMFLAVGLRDAECEDGRSGRCSEVGQLSV